MTQLRNKMLEELQRLNYSHRTATAYLRIVGEFAEHFHQAPDKLGPEHIRQYQAHLFQTKKLSPFTVSQYVSALRFLFVKTTVILHGYETTMIRGLLHVLTLLLILCLCYEDAQTRAAPAPSLSATPSDERPGVKTQHVSFATEDGGLIYADLYGKGDQGAVLAHGGRFTKESWQPQAQQLARAGFHVLAFDFRGFGQSHGPGDSDMDTAPMWLDVLAAVRYLRKNGAKTVAIVGGSFGGSAAADASIASQPGEINGLVLLAADWNGPAERIKVPLLVIVARDDANDEGLRLPRIRTWFDKAPQPKKLLVLEGSAHAQFLFQTDQSDRVMREVLQFLSANQRK